MGAPRWILPDGVSSRQKGPYREAAQANGPLWDRKRAGNRPRRFAAVIARPIGPSVPTADGVYLGDGLSPQVRDRRVESEFNTASISSCQEQSIFGRQDSRARCDLVRADYPWSQRLVALLPVWMPWTRVRLSLTAEVETLLLGMSARSVDRALHGHALNSSGGFTAERSPVRCSNIKFRFARNDGM